jgi:DNA-binding CsgD family transcriptional regulator
VAPAAARSAPATQLASVESKDTLRLVWGEIRELPVRQRCALLLNLRDGEEGNAVALLVLSGAATLAEIARTLEMPVEELAALWSRLPLDDLTIAARLGLTRQQVINLRKSARARLARRLGGAR